MQTPPPLEQQFEVIEGRHILTNAAYVLPKDTEEINRLDFQHFMLRNAMQGNYITPLSRSPRTVLDVGCGTGRWAQEIAAEFPDAYVVGCDLVEQKSDLSTTPPNYQFIENDVLKGLPFKDGHFDFVHQRLLFLAIPAASWQPEINELARVTAPGGWVELVETHLGGENVGPISQKIGDWMIAISRLRGSNPARSPQLTENLRLAGLQNTESRSLVIPVGSWGGRLGTMMATDMKAVARAMKPLIVSRLNITQEEFEESMLKQQDEWETLHTTATFHIAYGQKPL